MKCAPWLALACVACLEVTGPRASGEGFELVSYDGRALPATFAPGCVIESGSMVLRRDSTFRDVLAQVCATSAQHDTLWGRWERRADTLRLNYGAFAVAVREDAQGFTLRWLDRGMIGRDYRYERPR
jgi:hypothetical protein